jgi:pyruvate dehydrogenase E1 component
MQQEHTINNEVDVEPLETQEWLDSLDDVLLRLGPARVQQLLIALQEKAFRKGITLPFTANTPYTNTIHPDQQPCYPGNHETEWRIRCAVRWNAMAMVARINNKMTYGAVGGHISTFASSATLYEVGFNHFFHAPTADHSGDFIYFQGHASPGMYSRAFLEGRLSETKLNNFRQELNEGGGLCSYPHPWLMPDFWQFPTVSMGLGPISAIYHARFLRYMHSRGIKDTSKSKVWAFLGDGECDEPESLGAITLGSREKLDNLIFVINCNLQRLDGPVRGNGKIIQELEAVFRGAGWNVIKVVWGSDWDPLLAKDKNGALVRRMGEIVDGQFQKYVTTDGAYIRENFFGIDPELRTLVEHLSDNQLKALRRGGHDPEKVYAAYKAAVEFKGAPTVILAKTIKGYGLGESGEGRNTAHNQKHRSIEELLEFRSRFGIPISDEAVAETPFYKFPETSKENAYLHERRKALGGYLPFRRTDYPKLQVPQAEILLSAVKKRGVGSTTMALLRILNALLKDKSIGKFVVPIIPDEARTFGFESLFSLYGIYAQFGQKYDPVDKGEGTVMYYHETHDGQILEEGINEAGAMASFVAAGTAHANHGVPMIPIYAYYSMFGFQRVGDQIWLAADSRCKGFLIGGTAGRTTLNGEGLQHEDGHSHLVAATVPNIVAYDPAYAYELAVIIQDGLRRMYQDDEQIFYYITVYNDDYDMVPIPNRPGIVEGIRKGMYRFSSKDVVDSKVAARPQLLGSGPILRHVAKAQEILAEKYGISTDVWSVTSYKELRREGLEVDRWNLLHPDRPAKSCFVQDELANEPGPFIASSDYMRLVPEQIAKWIPGQYIVLGTDGFGRSDSRESLRRHFEIDTELVVYAALVGLLRDGKINSEIVKQAMIDLKIDPEKLNPLNA